MAVKRELRSIVREPVVCAILRCSLSTKRVSVIVSTLISSTGRGADMLKEFARCAALSSCSGLNYAHIARGAGSRLHAGNDYSLGYVLLLVDSAVMRQHTAVSIQWTGPLDWTTGLDYWTHICFNNNALRIHNVVGGCRLLHVHRSYGVTADHAA